MLRRSINSSQFNSSNQIKADQMESSQNFFVTLIVNETQRSDNNLPCACFYEILKVFEQILRRKFEQIDI